MTIWQAGVRTWVFVTDISLISTLHPDSAHVCLRLAMAMTRHILSRRGYSVNLISPKQGRLGHANRNEEHKLQA